MFFVRLFCIVLLCAALNARGYGQRVYANAEQHSSKQSVTVLFVTTTLSEVTSPEEAVDGDDGVPSMLFVGLGALGLFQAWQNLQFTLTDKPNSKTPIFLRLSSGTDLLGLIKGIYVQRTIATVPSGTIYTDGALLTLLTSGSTATIRVPPDGVVHDGIRLRLSADLLGAALSTNLYYAFFVKPPVINNATACFGTPANLTVTNIQPGYQYKWYTVETGGTALATTAGTYTTPSVTSAQTYYVEALDGGIYPSERTRVDINVLAKPVTPFVQLNN